MISHDARDEVESGVECRCKASLKISVLLSCILSLRPQHPQIFLWVSGDGGGV